MLDEHGWHIQGAPWTGDHVVYDVLGTPPASQQLWALRLFDNQPADEALNLLEADMDCEGSPTTGMVIGPDQSLYCDQGGHLDIDLIELVINLADRAQQVAYSL